MIITFDFLFRTLSIVLFLVWWMYWTITERNANREIPKSSSTGFIKLYRITRRSILPIFEVLLIFQLLGLQILPFQLQSVLLQLTGFIFVIVGVGVSIAARRELGINWVPAAEYQVKKRQGLVTTGVYSYIRHPIYLGVFLCITGGELVAQSYLVIICLVFLIEAYRQSLKEEKLLDSHFAAYKSYMKQTKMFVPYLW